MSRGGYKIVGVGHHPFSKKMEFKGYFDGPTPCLIATDYKAPKTVLEVWVDDLDETETKGERNLTKTNEVYTEVNGKTFTYVSLFSGIGGFETALNKLGGTCVLASEIDRFANQSYEALYGHATAGDITKIEAADVPDHDVLVGGFPCQAFSVAGKRDGFDDARGTLFFEVARLAKTKQPRMLLLENVKGLISHDGGKTLDTIVQTLNDIGYHVDFNVLNSKYFGVPQNRERIFIVALRDDIAKPAEWAIEGTNVVAKGKRRIAVYDGVKTFNFDFPEQTEVSTRLRDVLETEVDEKYYLSEEKTAALVVQLSDKTLEDTQECDMVGHVEIRGHDAIKRVYSPNGVGNALTTMGGGHREPKIAEEVRPVLTPDRIEKRQNGRRFKENDEESFTLTAQDRHGVAIGGIPIREATKQGYAIAHEGDAVNFQFPDSKTRRGRVGKQIANTIEASNINQGVVIDDTQGFDGIRIYNDETPTIRSQRHGLKVITPKYRVRKLTPRECWRLQGFSDEQFNTAKYYAKEEAEAILRKYPNHKGKRVMSDETRVERMSDSQLYKQAGNAVTVNVIHAIGERLLPYLS